VAEHNVHASPATAQNTSNAVPVLADPDSAQIAGVSSIILEPGSENVEVRFERMTPETAFGTLDRPADSSASSCWPRANFANPAAHDDSVISSRRSVRPATSAMAVPSAMPSWSLLRYDKDARVRRKALEGLESYISADTRVRDAVLEAVLHDSDADVRAEAISLLEPVDADSAVREVLQTVANRDQDQHIRTVSRQYLEQVSQIQ